MRRVLPVAALLVATIAFAEQKVSGGGTPPAGTSVTQPSAEDKAAAERNRREEARKALRALKGPAAGKADADTNGKDKRR